MRKIVLKMLNGRVENLESNCVTVGDLKADIQKAQIELDLSNAGFVERATKASYGAIPEAILPSGDLFLFVVPLRTKLGGEQTNAVLENLSYNELRSYVSKLNKETGANISLQGSRLDILERLKDREESPENTSVIEEIKMHAAKIIELVDNIKLEKASSNLVYSVSFDELEAESKKIAEFFKP